MNKKEKNRQGQMRREARIMRKGSLGPLTSDNVVIVWPVVMQLVDGCLMGEGRVLDFGCGTGEFCQYLHEEGLRVEGIDRSPANIRAATRGSSKQIRYHTGDIEKLESSAGKYDVITSLMSFPFIKDLSAYIPFLSDLLADRGTVIFTAFNPDFVENCYRRKILFRSHRTVNKTPVFSLELKKGTPVDAYVRSKDEYRRLFEKHGFEFLSSRYPPFTPEFVDQYGWKLPSEDAAYLAMAVRKK